MNSMSKALYGRGHVHTFVVRTLRECTEQTRPTTKKGNETFSKDSGEKYGLFHTFSTK